MTSLPPPSGPGPSAASAAASSASSGPAPGAVVEGRLLIERIAEVDSTSTALLQRPALLGEFAAAGAVATWLIAGHQTGGRGRRGRHWRSDPGASLAASFGIESALPAEPGCLTLVAGAAVAETLASFGAQPWLKWPNDVYLRAADGRLTKAGGILAESRILAAGSNGRAPQWRLVVGCGLNLFPLPAADWAGTGVPGPPPGHLFDREDPVLRGHLETALGQALLAALATALVEGPAAGLARWARFDLLAGASVIVHGASGAWQGVAEGVDPGGRLLVRETVDRSSCRALVAEEVSIRRLEA